MPLHSASAWHFLTGDPVNMNPSSQVNVTEFGNVVTFGPTKDPFKGTVRKPQSFAGKEQ